MIKYLCSVFILFFGFVYSQGEGGVFTQSRLSALKTGEGALGSNPHAIDWTNQIKLKASVMQNGSEIDLKDIQGSIYLIDEFLRGRVYFKNELVKHIYIRYNGFQDEIEIKEELNGQIKSLLKKEDYSVEYNDGEIHFVEFVDFNEKVVNGYLFSFYEGKEIVCYKRLEKKFKEGKKAKTSLQSSFPHRFIEEESYVGLRRGQLKQYKNTKKMIFSCVDDSKELKKYIKKNNLGFDNESDLKKILSYIDGQFSN